MTMTIHQLFHVAQCVKRFGPLWTTWMFTFESYNGFICSFVHSRQNVEIQLLDAFKLNQALLVFEDSLPQQRMLFCFLVNQHIYTLQK